MPERSPITVSIPEDFLLLTAQLPATTGGATVIDLPASRMGIKYAMTGAALMELGQRDAVDNWGGEDKFSENFTKAMEKILK